MKGQIKKVHILGGGVTAKAVRASISRVSVEEVDIDTADIVVASPGIPPSEYPKTDKEIISEIEFTFRWIKDTFPNTPIVAVTGTNGKTTVTSLIAHLLDVPAFGNIGRPWVESLVNSTSPKYFVLEVSSYQLEQSPTFKPDIAIYLNLTPDHLDRHKTIKNYAEAKARIFKNQDNQGYLLVGESVRNHVVENDFKGNLEVIRADNKLGEQVDPRQFVGRHNLENAIFALKTANILGVSQEIVTKRLKSYTFFPHRLENIGSVNGITCINDSKATNPEATMVAISAFKESVSLILAGYDKGLDWEPLVEFIRRGSVQKVYIAGGIRERFFQSVDNKDHLFIESETIENAVDDILRTAQKGTVLLLSPACSSFDAYKNFEERGNSFREYIQSKSGWG